MNCPHCDSGHVNVEVDEDELVHVEYRSCPLCGWTQIVTDTAPPEQQVLEAREMLASTFYAVVDEEGGRLLPWDIPDRDIAEMLAAQAGGQLHEWNMREDWDGTPPVPFHVRCLLCEKRIPIPETDGDYELGSVGCVRGDLNCKEIPDASGLQPDSVLGD